jgi:endonuclease III
MSASDSITRLAARIVDAAGVAIVADLAAIAQLAGVARRLAELAAMPFAQGARHAVDTLRAMNRIVAAAGAAGGAQFETYEAFTTTIDFRRSR